MQKKSPPYLLGLLCLIPLLGALVGIALILYGILKYKDKWLVIIGAAGIALTVFVYGYMFYNLKYGKDTARGFAVLSQHSLNSLINSIEFYKMQHGDYPDSLEQLSKKDEKVIILDPLLMRKMDSKADMNFRYEKLQNRYTLFSVGIDGISNTPDDIYPKVSSADSNKYSFFRKSELKTTP